MEALQVCPSSGESLQETTIGSSISYECLENRLTRIPGTPSSIVVPPPSPEPEPELAESFSTITTPTTTPEPASETSTAATSVLSLPDIFTVQNFHVSPSMPMDERLKAVWARQIKSRLSAVLLYSIPTGTCVQKFMMIGKRPDTLKPTLVITCGDAATKRRVEKTFKSQGWLQELLHVNHITFVALVAKTTLSAGPASNDGSTVNLSESYAVQVSPSGVTTSCGLGLLTSGVDSRLRQHCTLGGLLLVNGEILGLTAGHPFPKIEYNVMRRELLEAAQVVEDPSDEESSTNSSEPFVFNDDGDVNDDSTASTVSLHGNADVPSTSIDGLPHSQHETSRAFSPPMRWYLPQAAILPVSTPRHVLSVEDPLNDHDWALLETLPPSVTSRPNKIAHIDPRHDISIEGTVSGPTCGEVTITIAGIGPELGYLHSSPATMKVDESVLDVQLITLERVLPLGSSGAWVILGDKLCGYIIATRQDIPWAYMVAIGPIIEDIGRKLKTDDVRLPTAVEIESLTLPFEASNVKTPNKLEEEIPNLASEGHQIPISGEGSQKLWKAQEWSTWRHVQELPLTTDKYLPVELSDCLLNKKSHLSDQQEDGSLNEKSFILDDAPQTSMVQPSLPPGEPQRKSNEFRGSTICPTPPVLPTTIHGYPTPPTSTPLVRAESPSIGTSTAPAFVSEADSTDSIPYTRRGKTTLAPAKFSIALLHYTMIGLPCEIWHHFESLILRTEYRRRQRPCRSPIRWIWILSHPQHPGNDSFDVQTAVLKDIQIFRYYLRVPFIFILNVLFNILYFVVCFPFIFWVAHRHRDVLEDAKTLERQLHESLEMLGELPERYNDLRLLGESHRIRNEVACFEGEMAGSRPLCDEFTATSLLARTLLRPDFSYDTT